MEYESRRHKRVLSLVRRVLENNPDKRMTAREVQILIFDVPVRDLPYKSHRRLSIPTTEEIAAAMKKCGLRSVGREISIIKTIGGGIVSRRNRYECAEESL